MIWEYKILDPGAEVNLNELQSELNSLGLNRWELVGFDDTMMILKRIRDDWQRKDER